MSKKESFVKNFWKEKKMVGAMSPSSRFLAKKMLENIPFSSVKTLVELGPGTGVFTREILKKMAPDAKLLVFELNDSFMKRLKKEFTDPRVILIHDSAEKIGEYLEKNGLNETDAVISSLPLANFPTALKSKILLESFESLNENGIYVQFQYSLNAKNLIKAQFPKVKIAFTPLNFPPAFVYTCKKRIKN